VVKAKRRGIAIHKDGILILGILGILTARFVHPQPGSNAAGSNTVLAADYSGAVSFAATDPSERTMMTYAASGRISYWELDTGREIQNVAAPPNLISMAGLSSMPPISSGVSIGGGSVALGAVDGGIWLLGTGDTEPQAMTGLRLPN
jgi:hypothetical protein